MMYVNLMLLLQVLQVWYASYEDLSYAKYKIPDSRYSSNSLSKYFDILYPSLSSIELPLYNMGLKAAQMFLEIIKGGDVEK